MLFLNGKVQEALLGTESDSQDSDDDDNDEGNASYSDEDLLDGLDMLDGGESPSGARARAQPVLKIPLSITTLYLLNLLRDCANITSEPSKTSNLLRHGIAYMQSYSVSEEIFNVANIWAFQHHGIYNLGYSPEAWATLAGVGYVSSDRKNAETAFAYLRKRLAHNLKHNSAVSYGWRIELRVTRSLAKAVQGAEDSWSRLVRGDSMDSGRFAVRTDRAAFFVVPAQAFTEFLYYNIDKHLRLMDYINALYSGRPNTPSAAAALYSVTALALQQFTSFKHLQFFQTLGKPVDGGEGFRVGMGMEESMAERGFSFFSGSAVD